MRFRIVALSIACAVAAAGLTAVPADAAVTVTPVAKACSKGVDGSTYACLQVSPQRVPSGETATFTGTLSPTAMTNLKKWTKGDNIVCLTRYKTKPEADGSWPWQTLEGVCTTVRKSGGFTLLAELGRKGTFYYGLEMGPCRGNADLCSDGDPGLVGIVPKAVTLTTT